MRIALVEPYYGGSHRAWCDGYREYSSHTIALYTMEAQAWKWRMQGGAVTMARRLNSSGMRYDLIVVSDMLNIASFRGLLTHQATPIAVYFHENQLTYPQNSRQHHGWRYGFINYISALAADAIYFNSQYHLDSFLDTLPNMLKHFYDHNQLETVDTIAAKSQVLALGLNLSTFDEYIMDSPAGEPPLLLWNHRWEEDKNPKLFVQLLRKLMGADVDFRVAIVGEKVGHTASVFDAIREVLGRRLVAFGYQPSFEDYARLLWQADYVVSTSYQEFFGISVAEAMYCNCIPILPNRLNYPHLIPEALRGDLLYANDGDLFGVVTYLLEYGHSIDRDGLRSHICPFDWAEMAPRYDAEFTRLVQALA